MLSSIIKEISILGFSAQQHTLIDRVDIFRNSSRRYVTIKYNLKGTSFKNYGLKISKNYTEIERECQVEHSKFSGHNSIILDKTMDGPTIAKEAVKLYNKTLLSSDSFYEEYSREILNNLHRVIPTSWPYLNHIKVIHPDRIIKRVLVNIPFTFGSIGFKVTKDNSKTYLGYDFSLDRNYPVPNSCQLSVIDDNSIVKTYYDKDFQVDITDATDITPVLVNGVNKCLTDMLYITSIQNDSDHCQNIYRIIQQIESKWLS